MSPEQYEYLMKLLKAYKPEQLLAVIVFFQVEEGNTSGESFVSPMDGYAGIEFVNMLADTMTALTKKMMDAFSTENTRTER